MKKATPEEARAVTFVFWDIKRFPVPPGFDARRVRLCIKQFLEKHGYSGPLTINAVGILSDVHEDILGALSSTGINLYFSVFGCSSLLSLMFNCIDDNPPPANILGICDPVALPSPESGYNLFEPFSYSYSSPEENAINWISLILAESETLEDDTCSETDESASWFCLMRDPRTGDHLSGQGFESFSRHLSSLEHEKERFDYLPFESLENKDIAREEDENPPTIVRNQPKMATPEEAVAVTSVFWDINTFPVPLALMLIWSVCALNGFWRNMATLVLSPSLPLAIYRTSLIASFERFLPLESLSVMPPAVPKTSSRLCISGFLRIHPQLIF